MIPAGDPLDCRSTMTRFLIDPAMRPARAAPARVAMTAAMAARKVHVVMMRPALHRCRTVRRAIPLCRTAQTPRDPAG
ncbi:MAG: hypothetical protein RL216_778 [Pseudomonadota bacterium]|jgi:hypothetical protein